MASEKNREYRKNNRNKAQKSKVKSKVHDNIKRKTPIKNQVLSVDVNSAPNSCLVYIGKTRWRALIDTGADISVMSERMHKKLRNKSGIKPVSQALQGAGGKPLKVKGVTNLSFQLGKKEYNQKFYVVKEASRNLILGIDFLKKNQARIYFDLEKLRLNGEYIDLDRDIHIASVVRVDADVTLPPQSKQNMLGKMKKNPYFHPGQLCEFQQDEKSWMKDEPGLLVANSVSILDKRSRCKVLLVNSTNKTYKIKKGSVIGTVSAVDNSTLSTVQEVTKKNNKNLPDKPDFSNIEVPEQYKEEMISVLEANKDVFAAHDTDFGRTNAVKMRIDTKDHAPIKQRPYRTPLTQQKVVDEAVDEMLEKGVIEKSSSPWASPIVLVKKKDGSTRFCVDYRRVNDVTTSLAVPLPVIDDLLAILGKAVFFTTLDLISGYWQILMNESDKEKTAFCTTHRGLFQFKVMPFGLKNAPGVFTQLITQVLEGYEDFATSYIDDILCFSESLEDHIKHLEMIFQRLRQHSLKLKLKKCNFLQSETSYLGYKITRGGIKPEEDKVKAIRELAPPTSKKEVRSFIGSCSYYRKFLPNFSGIAKPLIDLTKKNTRFKWEEPHQRAFNFLKESLTDIPFLAYPDISKPFTLYTDASNLCIGACLTQFSDNGEELPVYFISHKLSDTQTRWSTIEKEAYAIFYAVNKLHYILYGTKFVIKTDHQPLIYLLNAPSSNKKVQNWMLQLAAYDCKIEHIKGTDNTMADMLSRAPVPKTSKPDLVIEKQDVSQEDSDSEIDVPRHTFHVQTLNSGNFNPRQFAAYEGKPEPVDLTQPGLELDMKEEQSKDPDICKILEEVKLKKKQVKLRYLVQDGVLYYLTDPHGEAITRLFVPEQLRTGLIKAYHDENGHFGVDKCYHTLARSYYWPNMFQDLWDYIGKCVRCNQRKLRKVRPPLKETEIPPYAFAKVSLDLAGPFPITLSGNKYVISFVDWLSGWIEAFPVADKTADTVVYLLQNEIFPRFGCPLVLVTDNGGENVNRAMKETLDKLKIHHVTTSVFHPQSNSKVERSHRTMNDVLCKVMNNRRCNTWDLHLPQVLAAMRFAYNNSTGQSPFSVIYGRDVVLPVDNLLQPRRKYYGEESHQILLEIQHEAFLRLHRMMKKQKSKQAKYANRGAQDIDYRVGDPVFLRNHKKDNKLAPSWQPYYRIIEQISPLTFRLKNQLTGEVVNSHAEHLVMARTEWEVEHHDPTPEGRTRCKNVVSEEEDSSDELLHEEEVGIDHTPVTEQTREEPDNVAIQSEEDEPHYYSMSEDISEDEEVEMDTFGKLSRPLKRERDGSSSEDDIPLAELSKRLKFRAERQRELQSGSSDDDVPLAELARPTQTQDDEETGSDE